MKQVKCGETGLFPGCEGVARGETEDEVMAAVAEHARDAHGVEKVDAETAQIIRSHIQDA
jgi:predicted small metal-binding protein